MSRNLIICCDGTANEFNQDRTNVLKLAFAAEKDPGRQLLYYHPGVGTMAPAGFFSRIGQAVARLAGLAFGYGLKNDIRDAYAFIINHYQSGDRIFLFGFSRGAYTARAVASLLHEYGLMGAGNDALLPYAIRMLWKFSENREAGNSENFKLAAQFKEALGGPACPIHFMGLWDTVSSVGWIANPLSLPFTRILPNAKIVRHAVSIDERRAFFRTNLIERDASRDIEEVWFPGVHCDVGGGYPEKESQLSKIPLQWMIDAARSAGLVFDETRVSRVLGRTGGDYAAASPLGQIHKSLTVWWWPAEFVFKKHWNAKIKKSEYRPNLFGRRHFGLRPCIDDSAWSRGEAYAAGLPTDAVKRSAVKPFCDASIVLGLVSPADANTK